MSDPFRRLFLDQLEVILKKEPSRKALLELIQTATPSLSSLGTANEIKKRFKTLLLRVHPDKHPQDVPRSTRLCQDAQNFYDECTAMPPEPKRRRTSASFPLNFSATEKWSHIIYDQPYVQPGHSKAEMSDFVGWQCINARGAIAHGRAPELVYTGSKSKATKTVRQVFKTNSAGVKELSTIEEIKQEIKTNGPVVSTSFRPSITFLSNNVIGRSDSGYQKDILIIGWKQISSGEVWLVQPLYANDGIQSPVAYVGVGQFGIDECCLAPTNSFENVSWQSGPYFDGDLSGTEWQTWTAILCFPNSLSVLEPLFKELGTASFVNTTNTGPVVTIRNSQKKAHSRKAHLRSIEWLKEEAKWQIAFDFI